MKRCRSHRSPSPALYDAHSAAGSGLAGAGAWMLVQGSYCVANSGPAGKPTAGHRARLDAGERRWASLRRLRRARSWPRTGRARHGPGGRRCSGTGKGAKVAEQARAARQDCIITAALARLPAPGPTPPRWPMSPPRPGRPRDAVPVLFPKEELFLALHEEWDGGRAGPGGWIPSSPGLTEAGRRSPRRILHALAAAAAARVVGRGRDLPGVDGSPGAGRPRAGDRRGRQDRR
jgi:hypothetical protein